MDELQISGKRFISSRRLAREHGYTADYLGQLIRGGKISGQKVGRAWYVDAASFEAYLGAEGVVAHVTQDAMESELEEKVAPQREVRSEVPEVSEEPIAQQEEKAEPEEIKEEAPLVEEEKEEEIKDEAEETEKEEEEEITHHIPLQLIKKEEPKEAEVTPSVGGLRYFSDTGTGLPEIAIVKKMPRPIDGVGTMEERSPVKSARKLRFMPLVTLAGAGIAVFVLSAMLSSALTLNLSSERGEAANAYYSLDW